MNFSRKPAQKPLTPTSYLIFLRNFHSQRRTVKTQKQTVIILDNARIHTAQKVKERIEYWQKRGLYIFYLPPYSPHLNIIERLWKELKARWIKPEDYVSFDDLQYATTNCLNQVGKNLTIKFSKYS